ncbi:MAG: IS110 family transposase [Ilumatobacteraceae bacterium]
MAQLRRADAPAGLPRRRARQGRARHRHRSHRRPDCHPPDDGTRHRRHRRKITVVAAVGDFFRFPTPDRLVAYLGLNPRVRQSSNAPAVHGRITKAGPAQARGMLVEAAFSAARTPGPMRAFIGASATAAACKSPPSLWPVSWSCCAGTWSPTARIAPSPRPSLTAYKPRRLELAAGATSRRGPVAGPSRDYHIKQLRDAEKALVEQAERAYAIAVGHWQPNDLR